MKPINRFFKYSLFLCAAALYTGCGSDDDEPAPDTSVSLSLTGTGLENTGTGQYRYEVETGNQVSLTVDMQSETELEELTITKTVNNAADPTFGTNGTMTVPATGEDFDYTFNYTPVEADVDKLVGFSFKGTNTSGTSETVDLTLVVTLSPLDNIPTKRWTLTSVYWVNEDSEEIRECQQDDSWLLNADGTIDVEYGENTGTGDCQFDGFVVWETWEITEEDGVQYFTRTGFSIFDPETPVVDTFIINELTTESMELQQTVDLSDLGGDPDQTFIYTYTAGPR